MESTKGKKLANPVPGKETDDPEEQKNMETFLDLEKGQDLDEKMSALPLTDEELLSMLDKEIKEENKDDEDAALNLEKSKQTKEASGGGKNKNIIPEIVISTQDLETQLGWGD